MATGSKTTVAQYMAAWRAANKAVSKVSGHIYLAGDNNWVSAVHEANAGNVACGMGPSAAPAKQLYQHRATWRVTDKALTCMRCGAATGHKVDVKARPKAGRRFGITGNGRTATTTATTARKATRKAKTATAPATGPQRAPASNTSQAPAAPHGKAPAADATLPVPASVTEAA